MEIMWPLILFTFFLSLASGIFLWQGILTIKRIGMRMQVLSMLSALVCYGLGGIFVLLHLASPLRIFNGFGHITSGITQEVIAMVLVVLAIIVFFLMYWRDENREAPKWCGIMAIVFSVVMVVVMAHSYWMASVPVWNNVPYILFFLCNMLAVGLIASNIIARVTRDQEAVDFLRKPMLIVFGVYILIVVVYAVFIVILGNTAFSQVGYYFDPTLPDVHMKESDAQMAKVFTGVYAPLFWIGTVIVGLIIPAALLYLRRNPTESWECFEYVEVDEEGNEVESESEGKKGLVPWVKSFLTLPAQKENDRPKVSFLKKEIPTLWIALVCALVGGICWRVILYVTAIHVFAIF